MRKLLCGIAVAVLALVGSASLVGAQEAEEEHAEDGVHAVVEEIHHLEEEGEIEFNVAECAILALENNDEERCQESPSPIMPATNELIYGGLAFLVLLGVLWKFGVPAASRMMTERADKIRNSLDEAERAKTEAETILAEYQRQLADARAESARIVEEARADAEQVRRDTIARAEAEANELRQRNAEQVGAERDRVMGEMQGQVAALAIELAEKVVESNLDREANTRLIENYINSVGAR
jgi:F-type H+-transporting ATPase subunit b